jgi:hypothetical protein
LMIFNARRAAGLLDGFFFNHTSTTEIYTLSYTLTLHDSLPIYPNR